MNKKEMNSKDLLLSFLYSPGQKENINEPIIGRTKLTKMMYLFEKEIYPKFFKDELIIELPDFKPYFYGPFSPQLFEDLSFFCSIGMICANETTILLSSADKVESDEVFEEDNWSEAAFGEEELFEKEYSLTQIGVRYVEDKVWSCFTDVQKDKLQAFKGQINKISLDTLLRYVYNKYPEDTKKSVIADKYLLKADD
ncbi:MAG: hypothetical protein IKB07_08945 [Lachnospiraceae bacterium]|nr:hypothetical protein [Lachnospiraceae bacterium]